MCGVWMCRCVWSLDVRVCVEFWRESVRWSVMIAKRRAD